MKRLLAILFFCSLSFNSFSQTSLRGILPGKGSSINSFIPERYLLIDSTSGDFNYDGRKDFAIVIGDSVQEKLIGEASRSLIILEATGKSYKLSEYCNSAILCYSCGGIYGDPYNEIKFEKNILTISHFGGSNWRWSNSYKFQFKDGKWVLIGSTSKSWWLMVNTEWRWNDRATYFNDINFLTGDYIEREINEGGKITKNIKGKRKLQKTVGLREFNISVN